MREREREADKKVSTVEGGNLFPTWEECHYNRSRDAAVRVVVTSHHLQSVFSPCLRVDSISGTATEVDDGDENQHLSRCFDKINANFNAPRHLGLWSNRPEEGGRVRAKTRINVCVSLPPSPSTSTSFPLPLPPDIMHALYEEEFSRPNDPLQRRECVVEWPSRAACPHAFDR